MSKIHSVSELKEIREKSKLLIHPELNPEPIVQIKIGMSTCGIASGAKEIMKVLEEECEQQAIDVQIKPTGCLGYCYAEPMIEVLLPNKKSKVFGFVDKKRAKEIVQLYILRGEPVEGEIKLSFVPID
jgi:NADP-reducing hydrogenase subunit HndB